MVYVAPTLLDGTPYPAAVWQAALDETERLSTLVALLPQMVRRTSDSSPAPTTGVLTNDTVLLHTNLVPNAVYLWEQRLIYDSSNVANFQWAYTVPAGTTLRYTSVFVPSGGTAWSVADWTEVSAPPAAGANVGTIRSALVKGLVIVGGAGGTLQTRWGQFTGNASNTILRAGSYSTIQQVA